MKLTTILSCLLAFYAAYSYAQTPLSDYDLNRPIGWGAMPGFEVTGGAGGQEVVVTSEEEFETAITTKNPATSERDVPMIIYVQGEIEFKQMHTWHVKNKTILDIHSKKCIVAQKQGERPHQRERKEVFSYV